MKSKFTGTLSGLTLINTLTFLLSICTLGICMPWAICIKQKWIAEHTYIDGKQLYFDGTAAQLTGNWFKWLGLSIITLGIYSFWVKLKLKAWITSHTHQR